MADSVLDDTQASCISHANLDFNYDIVDEIEERLRNSDKLTLSLEIELELLHELSEFELGKFLMQNQGLNGYFTHYIISGNHDHVAPNSLEYWILNHAPAVKATQERFTIFQAEIQKLLTDNMVLASLPCGLMHDLLSLDYSQAYDVTLVGIDIDSKSLELAQNNIADKPTSILTRLELKDAWSLDSQNQFDLITSNGLNIYETSDEKVIALYKKFYESLHKGGYLVTSFLTPPPTLDPSSTWRDYNGADVLKQKAIFADILQVKWQVFRTEEQTRSQLENAGFRVIKVIYDTQAMFPTIIAQK